MPYSVNNCKVFHDHKSNSRLGHCPRNRNKKSVSHLSGGSTRKINTNLFLKENDFGALDVPSDWID